MDTVCMLGHPAPGHVNPTLSIAAELAARGHHVVYFATEPFRAAIERTGAEFRGYGEHALFERGLAVGGILGGMAGLMETTAQILPRLVADLRALRPDYVLLEAHAVWGNLAIQHLRLPAVTLAAMFAMRRALISPAELVSHLYGRAPDGAILDGLLGLTRYFDLARRLDHAYGSSSPDVIDYLANPQPLTIVLTSREFQVGGDAFDAGAYRFVGAAVPDPGDASGFPFEWLDGRPLIFASMGTMYNDEADLYRACVEAFGGGEWQLVLAAGHRVDRALLAAAPAHALICEYVPQRALLERTALFVTHGGLNSAHEAMLAGVPMIVLPKAADHHIVARRVAEVGAGMVIDRAAATAARLRALASDVLAQPAYAARSRAMGDTLRAAGGARRAVDEITAYIRALRN